MREPFLPSVFRLFHHRRDKAIPPPVAEAPLRCAAADRQTKDALKPLIPGKVLLSLSLAALT